MDNNSECLIFLARHQVDIILLHYNYTGKLENRHLPSEGMSAPRIVFVVISCFIVIENLLVFVAIVNNTRFRSWVYYCIANITLCDLLTGIVYIVNICLSGQKTFQMSPTLWFIREGVLFFALAASTFSLLITAVERYATMVRPVPYASARKTYRVYFLIGLCWLVASLIGLLPLMGWNCICNFDECSTLLPLYSKSYILFCVVMFSIIIIGIVALYSSIYHLVRNSAKTVSSSRSKQKSIRLLKTVFMIVAAFVICWSPLFVLLLLDVFCFSPSCTKLHSMEWTIALAVVNSAINPIIYSFGSNDVKRAILKLLCCCFIKAGAPLPFLSRSESVLGASTDSSYRLSNRNSKLMSPKKTLPKSGE
ncbi:sphingosine 1-phosphate receptor 4 [Scyliorhinus canicula]|uniref:sphingosine 1-phosphate receptor 4 n=1 Tax=Scyliorhinus canicula TaxID=7830 RepID=UPI0018F4FA7E|nr:sphingosine 1-phosphate receptor 4 [Scyliorhinus canicula]XP_038633420.1 sphingosine 1-phosphate receptor 4 [Scyliorhinus canicula]